MLKMMTKYWWKFWQKKLSIDDVFYIGGFISSPNNYWFCMTVLVLLCVLLAKWVKEIKTIWITAGWDSNPLYEVRMSLLLEFISEHNHSHHFILYYFSYLVYWRMWEWGGQVMLIVSRMSKHCNVIRCWLIRHGQHGRRAQEMEWRLY